MLLVACGPSSAQIKEAREAHYTQEPGAVFEGVLDAVKASGYPIAQYDEQQQIVETVDDWYDPDGNHAPKSATGGRRVVDGSVDLAMHVEVKGQDGDWQVVITPEAAEYVEGSPQARPLGPNDPVMTGWVQGKVDDLYIAIHKRLALAAHH